MDPTIEKRVYEVVRRELRLRKREQISRESSLVQDLAADSLSYEGLKMGIESEFGITISNKDAEKIATVGDIIDYVASRYKEH